MARRVSYCLASAMPVASWIGRACRITLGARRTRTWRANWAYRGRSCAASVRNSRRLASRYRRARGFNLWNTKRHIGRGRLSFPLNWDLQTGCASYLAFLSPATGHIGLTASMKRLWTVRCATCRSNSRSIREIETMFCLFFGLIFAASSIAAVALGNFSLAIVFVVIAAILIEWD